MESIAMDDEDLPIFRETLLMPVFETFPAWVPAYLDPPDFSDLIPAAPLKEMLALLSPTQVMEVLS